MTTMCTTILFLILMTTFLQSAIGVEIEIQPNRYTDQTASNEAVTITCKPGSAEQCAGKDIMMLRLKRKNEQGNMAFVRVRPGGSRVKYVTDTTQTSGQISRRCDKSYLRVTLSSPKMADNGSYECFMAYYDQSGAHMEEKASGKLTVEISQVSTIVQTLQDKVSELEGKLDEQASNFSQISPIIETLQDKVLELEGRLEEKASKSFTAFSARLVSNVNLNTNNVLVFQSVDLNEGGAYDRRTGIFTAPRNGIFAFQLSLRSQHHDTAVRAQITVNGAGIAPMHALDKNYWDMASTSALTRLEKGDQVKVVMWGASQLSAGGNFSRFSGFLVRGL